MQSEHGNKSFCLQLYWSAFENQSWNLELCISPFLRTIYQNIHIAFHLDAKQAEDGTRTGKRNEMVLLIGGHDPTMLFRWYQLHLAIFNLSLSLSPFCGTAISFPICQWISLSTCQMSVYLFASWRWWFQRYYTAMPSKIADRIAQFLLKIQIFVYMCMGAGKVYWL